MDIQHEVRKDLIARTRKQIKDSQIELNVLIAGCDMHQIIEVYDSARCDVCGTHFGWFCPESPNGVCDYDQPDGSYDEDNCIHCGNPEERK